MIQNKPMPPDRASLRAEDALEPMDKARQIWLRQDKEATQSSVYGILMVKRAFAAGFAAGVAHATTTVVDPATVTAMRELLGEIGASTVLFTGDVIVGWEQRGDWQRRIAKLLEAAP